MPSFFFLGICNCHTIGNGRQTTQTSSTMLKAAEKISTAVVCSQVPLMDLFQLKFMGLQIKQMVKMQAT